MNNISLKVSAGLLLMLFWSGQGVNADPTPATALAATATPTQNLVEQVITANPDMLDVLFHVTPPGEARNIVIAAHLRHAIGELSGDDDLGVMNTGKPIVEVQKDGIRIGVLVPLHDRTGKSIGALGLMYPYHAGDDQMAILRRSIGIRDRLAAKIPTIGSLFSQKPSLEPARN